MEESGKKWEKVWWMSKLKEFFSIDPSKYRYKIQIQNKDRSHQGYRYKDHPKIEIQNTVINIIYNRFELYGSSSSNYNTDDIVIHICSMESIIKEEEG